MGLHEDFRYFRCSRCGCVQIAEQPEDMSRYYSSDKYYSFNSLNSYKKRPFRERWIDKHFYQYAFWKRGKIGAILHLKEVNRSFSWISKLHWNAESSILDVGCGDGKLLYIMRDCGFKDLTGADPFIENEVRDGNLSILKKRLDEIDRKFDVVILSHSMEHVFDQNALVKSIYNVLKDDGIAVIRLPLFSDFLYQKFGKYTQSLVPPRHFYLHTLDSINRLFASANLQAVEIMQDPHLWGFMTSERNRSRETGTPQTPWQMLLPIYHEMCDKYKADCYMFIVQKKPEVRPL
ncbi:MAG: class I SAM-dependent methyltransferase [Thermoguttaceae bacterium]|nr:class I SAM-dependent methyltransferase [Thermoguttaceae bacterium]